ncbi:MAG TPA: hypothetical protein VGR47_09250 [Terracidiphilus sp.]|nr:hypothetical protein [Terracidiphilus sp.]
MECLFEYLLVGLPGVAGFSGSHLPPAVRVLPCWRQAGGGKRRDFTLDEQACSPHILQLLF